MAQLTDLELDRVDGVDEPATGQRFLLLKAEEPDELRANVQDLLTRVEAALTALAAIPDLALTDAAATALNDVAKALGRQATFRAKAPAQPADTAADEYGYPPPAKRPARKAEDTPAEPPAAVAKALAALETRLGEHEQVLKALIDRLAAPPAPVRSQQPRSQDALGTPAGDRWRRVFFG